jgi:hypothetical protein
VPERAQMITSARSLDGLVWPRNPLVQQLVEADPLLPLALAQAPRAESHPTVTAAASCDAVAGSRAAMKLMSAIAPAYSFLSG